MGLWADWAWLRREQKELPQSKSRENKHWRKHNRIHKNCATTTKHKPDHDTVLIKTFNTTYNPSLRKATSSHTGLLRPKRCDSCYVSHLFFYSFPSPVFPSHRCHPIVFLGSMSSPLLHILCVCCFFCMNILPLDIHLDHALTVHRLQKHHLHRETFL